MIPRVIHYCWFGGRQKTENIIRYIQTWKDKLPGYRFVEWNETNFDIQGSLPYVREAYEAQKYAFVSDYVRLHALCEYGGVYLDTDIEVVKDFSHFLAEPDMLLCYESKDRLCTAFMASAPGNPVVDSFRKSYEERGFLQADGSLDTTTINQMLTEHMIANGIEMKERNHTEPGNIAIYTSDYFSAQDLDHGHPNITENTYAIHRCEGSWNAKQKGLSKVIAVLKYRVIRPGLQKTLGYRISDKILDILRKI